MTILSRRKAVLVKLEATYGTDSVPVPATDAVLCKTVNATDPLNQTYKDREIIRPFFGQFQQIAGGDFATIELWVEAAGFGTAGPAAPTPGYDALLQCVALSRTITATTNVVYAPISSVLPSCTIYFYQDGAFHKLTGCRGELELTMQVNEVPYYKFTMTGLYNAVVDAALPTPVITAYTTPVLCNADNTTAVSVHGFSAFAKTFTFKTGNQIEKRELLGGSRQVLITDRRAEGTIDIENVLVAAKNFWTDISTNLLGPMSITHGTVVGNKVTLSSANTQLINPKFSDDQSIVHLSMGIRFVAVAGGDDFALTIL